MGIVFAMHLARKKKLRVGDIRYDVVSIEPDFRNHFRKYVTLRPSELRKLVQRKLAFLLATRVHSEVPDAPRSFHRVPFPKAPVVAVPATVRRAFKVRDATIEVVWLANGLRAWINVTPVAQLIEGLDQILGTDEFAKVELTKGGNAVAWPGGVEINSVWLRALAENQGQDLPEDPPEVSQPVEVTPHHPEPPAGPE